MKSIYKYIVCVCTALAATSCDFLDVVPDNVATEEHAFADRYTVEKYLASCYWRVPKAASMSENPGIHGAMEMILNTEYSGDTGMKLGLGQDSPTSALMNYWASSYSLYAGIRDCNTFMMGIGDVKDLDEYEKKRMIAEVKMLKAYFHFYLLSYYGPICPLRESPAVNESTQAVRVYREKVDDCFSYVLDLMDEVIEKYVGRTIGDDQIPEEWDLDELNMNLLPIIPLEPITFDPERDKSINKNELIQKLKEEALHLYEMKEAEFPEAEQIREIERVILLKVTDQHWMNHIDDMDQLRQGIGLQAYGQRDPVTEYRFQSYDMFAEMTESIREETVKALMHVRIEQKVEREQVAKETGTNKDDSANAPVTRKSDKVSRNAPCPCGSGKKYKYCCGR